MERRDQIANSFISPNCIDTSIFYEGKIFFASFVYGNNDRMLRKAQWDQLIDTANTRKALWLVTSDFNEIFNSHKKRRRSYKAGRILQ